MPRNGSSPLCRIERKDTPTFFFIGVATARSSIMRVFPTWMHALGRMEVEIEGVDLPPHAERERYRQVVARIKHDALSLGGLVTTHKIDLLEAASDMFEDLDPYARICGEVSCISKRDGHLVGHAKDPITAGLSLDAILGEGYFGRTGGEVLCFGAGGAATAIALHLIRKENAADRPFRYVVVNRSPARLERLRKMVETVGTDIAFKMVCNGDSECNDQIMSELPPCSVVINATGMGKDRPGSPVTDAGPFPENGLAWELNYRGSLGFMRQALAQQDSLRLGVEDGWLYFLHGWTQVIAQVLSVTIDGATFDRLAALAASVR